MSLVHTTRRTHDIAKHIAKRKSLQNLEAAMQLGSVFDQPYGYGQIFWPTTVHPQLFRYTIYERMDEMLKRPVKSLAEAHVELQSPIPGRFAITTFRSPFSKHRTHHRPL